MHAWFDEAAAERVLRFWGLLRHVKGRWAGQQFVLLPWQQRVLRDLFGWKRADGTRKYRTAYISVPRKQGKSTLAAGIALYLLLADGEYGAEVVSAAADRDQASIVFGTAKAMVEASPPLRRRVRIYKRAIEVPRTNSVYRVLSADAPRQHGINAHGIIFDELHAQPDRELWDALATSMGARTQPLLVAITTAGYDRESICYEVYDYAKRVLNAVVEDEAFYACIFEAGESDDWTNEATWSKANPSLGHTVSIDFLRQEYRRALASPAYQNTFRRLFLNQWVQAASRWLDLSVWDANEGGPLDEQALRGRLCFGGLDLSSTTDLTAWVLVFPGEAGSLDVLARCWVPEFRLRDTSNRWAAHYAVWARDGWLRVLPGRTVDYDYVMRDILDDAEKFKIHSLNIDRLFQAHQVAVDLERAGLKVFGMGQGFMQMSGPTKELERLLLAQKIRHHRNPVLRWMADNVVVKSDPAGNIRPSKAESQAAIDGIVALIMAVDRWMRSAQSAREEEVHFV